TLNKHGAPSAIPPRKGAKIWQHANTKAERHMRDENLRRIRKVGRKQWQRESNYHRRSLAETQVFRFKTIFGDRLQTRQIDNQFKELLLKSAILNRMTHLGMPDSVKVTG
ncbi:MAG: IS5/IS1182 family transposase, partial [Acidobacteria bacterium]|nr:IS5/IS1182 family transposase [Acidobacteriota bacterium]